MNATLFALLLAAPAPTMDLKAGAILCHDERAATALVEAVSRDPDRLPWLMNGACTGLPIGFRNQRVVKTMGAFPKIMWSNGKWEQERVVIPPSIAARAHRLLPDPAQLEVS